MTQFIQAIYEQGVFRPLEPIALPEHELVSLAVSEATALSNPRETDSETLRRQSEALSKLRSEMDALPGEAPQDGLGGADHDFILYGWKK